MLPDFTLNARILFWVALLGVVGGLLQAKAAVIETNEILVGVFIGGVLGLILGRLFAALDKREHREARRQQD